ncbi:MAG: LysR family transcriptional regulator [Paracoccaceae bacterium]
MRDVDTALLRTFVTLAETGSFSRTGALIGRSQSAVSGQIARLEERLGRRLLERDTRNVRLSAEGERLLGPARAMLAQGEALLAQFAGEEIAGVVRFGSPEDFASAYLPDILGVFAAAHARVDLHVTCDLTLPLMAALAAGEEDIIIIKQDPAAPHPGARALWREALVWVGAREMAFDAGQVRLVLSPAPCVYRGRAIAALDGAGVGWTGVFTSPSFTGCTAAVRAGLGVAVMPRAMVPAGLVVQGADWPQLPEAEMAVLCAPRPSRAVAALAAFIVDQVPRRRFE